MIVVEGDHIGRKFFNAIQNQNMEAAADYLTTMVEGRVNDGVLTTPETMQIFISSHLITAFDLSGNVRLNTMAPFDDIITSEVQRYTTEYRGKNNAIGLMIHHIMQKIGQCTGMEPENAVGRMEIVRMYIEKNYSDLDLSLNDLAEKFDLSVSYLSRTFKNVTGSRLSDYIHNVRVRHACELLRDTDLSVTEIAGRVGYASSSAFIRSYRNIEGITPGTYRERARRVQNTEKG